MARLCQDAIEQADARLTDPLGDDSVPMAAYSFVVSEPNRRQVNLQVTKNTGTDQEPLKTPFFNMGDDFIVSLNLVRSLMSRRELDSLNAAEVTKLAGVLVTCEMLALALCTYVKNVYAVCRTGRQRNAVPTKAVSGMLKSFGHTQVDGSHVRIMRDALRTMGLLWGDKTYFTGRCERFRVLGPALDLPCLAGNCFAEPDREARDAERLKMTDQTGD